MTEGVKGVGGLHLESACSISRIVQGYAVQLVLVRVVRLSIFTRVKNLVSRNEYDTEVHSTVETESSVVQKLTQGAPSTWRPRFDICEVSCT